MCTLEGALLVGDHILKYVSNKFIFEISGAYKPYPHLICEYSLSPFSIIWCYLFNLVAMHIKPQETRYVSLWHH